MSDKQLCLNR